MKTALITGTSRGIGFATAKKFLAEGWFVIGTSTKETAPITEKNYIHIQVDFLKEETFAKAFNKIQSLEKKIDVLINNAGFGEDEECETINIDLLKKTLMVNIVGTASFTNLVLPILENPSHIVNVSSRSASMTDILENNNHISSYKISKVGLNMYTRLIALDLQEKGITVSAIDPGWVKTDMGGEDAPRTPEEAALDIYNLAIQKVPTGQFWLNGKQRSW